MSLVAVRRRKQERDRLYDLAEYRALLQRVAENLSALRHSRQYSQEEAAHVCDVTLRLYQRLETGESNATMLTLARIAKGMKVDVSALFHSPGRRGSRS